MGFRYTQMILYMIWPRLLIIILYQCHEHIWNYLIWWLQMHKNNALFFQVPWSFWTEQRFPSYQYLKGEKTKTPKWLMSPKEAGEKYSFKRLLTAVTINCHSLMITNDGKTTIKYLNCLAFYFLSPGKLSDSCFSVNIFFFLF